MNDGKVGVSYFSCRGILLLFQIFNHSREIQLLGSVRELLLTLEPTPEVEFLSLVVKKVCQVWGSNPRSLSRTRA
jgi:hypothetical protein